MTRSAAITAHPPPQHTGVSTGQAHCRRDKATRTACPRLATCQRIAATGADCTIVTALKKAAATAKDVLECATVDADLQNAAIKGVLKCIVVAEHKNRICEGINRNRRRIEMLVADRSWIIDPCRIWRRVGRRHRKPGIRRYPRYSIGIDHIAGYPSGRQDWRSYVVEALQ